MGVFPSTPQDLLARLRSSSETRREAAWTEFYAFYEPVIRRFLRLQSASGSPDEEDDLVQDVFLRLSKAVERSAYDSSKARFRTYLATLVKHILIDRLRARAARRLDRMQSLDEENPDLSGEFLVEPAVEVDPAALIDLNWRLARHQAAEAHVFAESALSDLSRQVYLLATVEGLSNGEIAKRLNVGEMAVRRMKSRVIKRIAAVEDQFSD